jgi:hypothetical protein
MGDAPIDAKSSRADDEAVPAGAAPDMLKEEGVAWTGARRLLRAPLEVGGSSERSCTWERLNVVNKADISLLFSGFSLCANVAEDR